jgi:NAD dependent epimerase/dehydratase family enzyme
VDVATAWEAELFEGALPATRRVALRMAIVIGDGPATRMLLRLARAGLGGTQYDGWCPPHRRYRGIGAHATGQRTAPSYRTGGRQRFSWVHIDDVVSAIRFIRDDDRLAGPINIASPFPSDNRTLMRTLRRVVGAPVGLPTRRWMLELGMWALRTESELILKSRWVLPGILADAGFAFAHEDLEAALTDVHLHRVAGSDDAHTSGSRSVSDVA